MAVEDPKAVKRHWFLLAFAVAVPGSTSYMSTFAAVTSRNLSGGDIAAVRIQKDVPESAVLMNASYLGYMTQYKFTNTSPVPVPSTMTPAYTLGLSQAVKAAPGEGIVSPYDEGTFENREWQRGYDEGLRIVSA